MYSCNSNVIPTYEANSNSNNYRPIRNSFKQSAYRDNAFYKKFDNDRHRRINGLHVKRQMDAIRNNDVHYQWLVVTNVKKYTGEKINNENLIDVCVKSLVSILTNLNIQNYYMNRYAQCKQDPDSFITFLRLFKTDFISKLANFAPPNKYSDMTIEKIESKKRRYAHEYWDNFGGIFLDKKAYYLEHFEKDPEPYNNRIFNELN
jgi:hypothetical protein